MYDGRTGRYLFTVRFQEAKTYGRLSMIGAPNVLSLILRR